MAHPSDAAGPTQLELPDLTLSALDRLAMQLIPLLRKGDFIALSGDLGAGKTAFARALILRLLGPDQEEEVPSPSFALLQSYETPRMPVYHFDFYRLSEAEEARELGLDEALTGGLVLAEWPERLGDALPAARLDIRFNETDDPEQRHLSLTARGAFAGRLQRFIEINRFLMEAGWDQAWRQFLQGDASPRAYTRLVQTDATALLMDAPRQPDGPPIRDGKPYSQLSHLAEDVRPFVAIADALRASGFSAPRILAHNLDKGLLLIEDFGDDTVGKLIADGEALPPCYLETSRALARLAKTPPLDELPLPDGSSYHLPAYDFEAYSIELELLLDWFWPLAKGEEPSANVREEYLALWRQALEPVMAASDNWALRDVHSPNLIWLNDRQETDRVGFIDFQDAQRGHAAYDLVSLLQDARLTVPRQVEQDCLELYLRETGFGREKFLAAYATLGAQRNSKILGIFIRLFKRDHKPAYLAHMPRVADYLGRDLQHPALADLKHWYDEHIPLGDLPELS